MQWSDLDKPWVGSRPPCNKTGMAFSRASTTITIYDGNKTSFWHANCIGDGALSGSCPLLFTIATRKNMIVHCEVRDNKWIFFVTKLNTPDQLREFVALSSIIMTTTSTLAFEFHRMGVV